MPIAPTATAAAATSTAAAATPPQQTETPAKPVISSDFETFLKMLTVQMENQDPLNPIESSDYAVQLATFSGVEQQVQTNDLIRSLTSSLGQNQLSDLSDWIGREVPAPVAAEFSGSPLTLSYEPHPAALSNELVVTNSVGQVIQRSVLPEKAGPIDWAGIDGLGDPVAHDRYSFTMVSSDADGIIAEKPLPVYLPVTEVQRTPTGVNLVIDGRETIGADTVTSIRAAG